MTGELRQYKKVQMLGDALKNLPRRGGSEHDLSHLADYQTTILCGFAPLRETFY